MAFLAVACSPKTEQQQTETGLQNSSPSLEQVWASDTLLRTPESVLYDREREVIYVSNINMNPWEKDGNGFLSRMDLEGHILDLQWVTGLSAPKGMGILGNALFVADIAEVVEIDLPRPRTLDMMTTPKFGEIVEHIRSRLDKEAFI